MKKNIQHFFLSLSIAILFLLSCTNKKVDDGTPKPATTNASLRLTGAVTENGNYKTPADIRNSFFVRYFPNSTPRPLIIAFHGGGFIAGDKSNCNLPLQFDMTSMGAFTNLITANDLDNNGFVYASANYTLLAPNKNVTAINPLTDCKDFLNYMRANAAMYNIDPNKIILIGNSAGACASLWIGLQNNNIKGIVAINPQATLNILKWRNQVFLPFGAQSVFDNNINANLAMFGLNPVQYSMMMYGTTNATAINNYSNTHKLELFDLFNASDPELYMACGSLGTDAIHYTAHDWALKQKSLAAGHNSRIAYTNSPYFLNTNAETVMQFCVRKFQ